MRRLAALALAAVAALAACTMDGDRGLVLEVVNRTDHTLTIRYEGARGARDLGVVPPGSTLTDREIFRELQGCDGPFVARQADGTEVARGEVCPNVSWRIEDAAPTSS